MQCEWSIAVPLLHIEERGRIRYSVITHIKIVLFTRNPGEHEHTKLQQDQRYASADHNHAQALSALHVHIYNPCTTVNVVLQLF